MSCYPQEDENKADENGGEDENEREALTNDSDGLPVVKGVCVDYVHANRDGASVFGRQKWMETGRYTMHAVDLTIFHMSARYCIHS